MKRFSKEQVDAEKKYNDLEKEELVKIKKPFPCAVTTAKTTIFRQGEQRKIKCRFIPGLKKEGFIE